MRWETYPFLYLWQDRYPQSEGFLFAYVEVKAFA